MRYLITVSQLNRQWRLLLLWSLLLSPLGFVHSILRPFVILIILTATLFFASTAKAESSCPWGDGGYCVDTLARETLRVVKEAVDPKTESIRQEVVSKLTLPEGQAASDGLSRGISYFNLYDTLWSSGLFQNKQATFDEAAAAGGTKIGGINLVVLGARTLQRMAACRGTATWPQNTVLRPGA